MQKEKVTKERALELIQTSITLLGDMATCLEQVKKYFKASPEHQKFTEEELEVLKAALSFLASHRVNAEEECDISLPADLVDEVERKING